ncbi:MAG: GtrA family protein [Actinomycetota bacterium]|nr:GtrA family protein [Actinomycetota bacterium]
MPIIDRVREHLPPKYREMAKFLIVGGGVWIVDTGLFTLMSHTVLREKVIVAKTISILVSTVLSYILNREWSFRTRGGRERPHEALLFFLVNGLALGLNLIPLALSRYVFHFNLGHHTQFAVSLADFISANIIGTLLGMAFRYWAYRRYVFPEDFGQDRQVSDETPDPDIELRRGGIA